MALTLLFLLKTVATYSLTITLPSTLAKDSVTFLVTVPSSQLTIPLVNVWTEKNRSIFLEKLPNSECDSKHEKCHLARSKEPGAGKWLLKRSEYTKWKAGDRDSSDGLLWVNGKRELTFLLWGASC